MIRRPPDRDLQRRAIGARQLVRHGEIDGPLALSYVVWPTPRIDAAYWTLPDPKECRFPGTGWSGYERGCRCDHHRETAAETQRAHFKRKRA